VQAFVWQPASFRKVSLQTAFNDGAIIGESQNFTRVLVNEPGNKLTPTEFGKRAAAMAKKWASPAKYTPRRRYRN